jgi:hypothetical protein
VSSHPAYPCCARQVPDRGGHCKDGEKWTCPTCERVWIHCCDEGEGCEWGLATVQPPAVQAADRELTAWLLARGWMFEGGMWRLATKKGVHQVASAAAAKVVQDRREAARFKATSRSWPGSR